MNVSNLSIQGEVHTVSQKCAMKWTARPWMRLWCHNDTVTTLRHAPNDSCDANTSSSDAETQWVVTTHACQSWQIKEDCFFFAWGRGTTTECSERETVICKVVKSWVVRLVVVPTYQPSVSICRLRNSTQNKAIFQLNCFLYLTWEL